MNWKVWLMAVVGMFAVSSMYALNDAKPNEFKIGVGGWNKSGVSDYSVGDARVLKDNQSGYSINLGYEHLKSNSMYGALDIDFRGYEGRTDGKTDRSDFFYDAQLRLGYAFGVGKDFAITPFTGVGAQSSKLDLESGSDYNMIRKWYYWTVGLRMDGSINENWDLGVRAQVMPMLSQPKVYNNTIGVAMERANKKINYSVDLPITYNLTDSGSALRLTPFFSTQNMGVPSSISDVPSDAVKTNMWGARFEYVYKF